MYALIWDRRRPVGMGASEPFRLARVRAIRALKGGVQMLNPWRRNGSAEDRRFVLAALLA